MNSSQPESLGALLLKYNLISDQDLGEALEEQRRNGGRLGEILVRRGYLKEDMLCWCLANQLNIPCVSTIDTRPDRLDLEALNRLPAALAYKHHAVPLLYSGNELTIVTDDPLDREGLQELERLTGLRLNVAAGPASEILHALEELYGPPPGDEPLLMPEEVEYEYANHDQETALEALNDWLSRQRAAGHLRIHLEPDEDGGRFRVRSRGGPGRSEAIDPTLFMTLMAGLKEACGIGRITDPVLRPFALGEIEGTVAFGAGSHGTMAVVAIDAPEQPLAWAPEWSQAMKDRLPGPGLWLLGVAEARLWHPVAQGLVEALEPDRRVLVAHDTWRFGDDPERGALEALEGLLGLEPDLVVLPASARGAVIELLRAGLPETTLVLQVAARSPLRALQILRSSGMSGPEMAEIVRGAVCVSTVGQACAMCRNRELEHATVSAKLAAGAEGAVNLEVHPGVCALCQDRRVIGDLPVLAWSEMNAELEAALADDQPLSSQKKLLTAPGLASPRAQVLAYLEKGLISSTVGEAGMSTWSG